MTIINIANNYSGNSSSINIGCTFNMGSTEVFRHFMKRVEECNERMRALLHRLAEAIEAEEKKLLLAELSECQQASERELELYRKLLLVPPRPLFTNINQ